MMRNKLLVATILCIAVLGEGQVSAQPTLESIGLAKPKTIQTQKETKEEPKVVSQAPQTYTVALNDTLIGIAEAHTTTWERLWQKNLGITHPDVINVGDSLIIPQNDEVLADRPVPTPVATTLPQSIIGSLTANLYEAGQCTWYVKNRKPSIPSDLGDASSWLYSAQAKGLSTGSIPRAGAVGWTSGHVVYIESVNSDGTVNYSDMNGRWVAYEVGHGTVSASKYVYIY